MDINIFINRIEIEKQLEDTIMSAVSHVLISHNIDLSIADDIVEITMQNLTESSINLIGKAETVE